MDEKTLMDAISRCTTGTFSIQDLQKILKVASAHPTKEPMRIGEREGKIIRPLLLIPEGTFLLMTDPHRGDVVVGKGHLKLAMFAIHLDTAEICVITVNKKELCVGREWTTLLNELELLKQVQGDPKFLQLKANLILNEECTIITQYCNGGDLMQEILSRKLSFLEILQTALDISEGVQQLHSLDVIHRDIRPQNIFLLKKDDGSIRAVIGDLGEICKKTDLQARKHIVWHPYWMAPEKAKLFSAHLEDTELWQAATTPKEDIWNLGVLFFLLFRGGLFHWQQKPSPDAPDDIIINQCANLSQETFSKEIQNSRLPHFFIPLIHNMLQIDPDKRPTAETVHKELLTIKSLITSCKDRPTS